MTAASKAVADKWHTSVEALDGYTDLEPVWFKDTAPKDGSPMGSKNGFRIFLNKDSPLKPAKGEVWLCKLDDKGYGDFMFAMPIMRMGMEFFEDVCTGRLAGMCAQVVEALSPKLRAEYFRFLEKDQVNTPEFKELSERMGENEGLKKQIEKEKADNTALREKLASQASRSKTQSDAWEKERSDLKSQIESLKTSKPADDASKSVARLEKAVSDKDKQISDLSGEIDAKSEQIAKLEGSIKNLKFKHQTEMDKLKEERDTAVRQKEAVVRHNSELNDQKTSKADANRIRDLERSLNDCHNQIAELNGMLETKQKAVDELTEAAKAAPKAVQSASCTDVSAIGQAVIERANALMDRLDRASMMAYTPSIRRRGGDILESDWFTKPRYSVRVSPDRRTMEITADPHGRAVCHARSLHLHGLDLLLPHDGVTRYLDVSYSADMASATVSFGDGGRE